jgi:hypothetical protein
MPRHSDAEVSQGVSAPTTATEAEGRGEIRSQTRSEPRRRTFSERRGDRSRTWPTRCGIDDLPNDISDQRPVPMKTNRVAAVSRVTTDTGAEQIRHRAGSRRRTYPMRSAELSDLSPCRPGSLWRFVAFG